MVTRYDTAPVASLRSDDSFAPAFDMDCGMPLNAGISITTVSVAVAVTVAVAGAGDADAKTEPEADAGDGDVGETGRSTGGIVNRATTLFVGNDMARNCVAYSGFCVSPSTVNTTGTVCKSLYSVAMPLNVTVDLVDAGSGLYSASN